MDYLHLIVIGPLHFVFLHVVPDEVDEGALAVVCDGNKLVVVLLWGRDPGDLLHHAGFLDVVLLKRIMKLCPIITLGQQLQIYSINQN